MNVKNDNKHCFIDIYIFKKFVTLFYLICVCNFPESSILNILKKLEA